jgi:hypothetical protein
MFKFSKKLPVYIFHMSNGSQISVKHVKELTMGRSPTGNFSSYSIIWVTGKTPEFFSLSILDIVAVTTQ